MIPQIKSIPHLYIVVGVCLIAIGGYAGFSIWIIWKFPDATMVGDIIGTWKSFAVLAVGFWIGSSSGGKAQVEPPPKEEEPE